jgi:hypothetical protein
MDTALLELIRGVLTIGAGAWLWQSFQKKIEKIDDLEKRIMYFEIRDKILQQPK